jgi:nicotinate-nucleotide adenylyltransferase
LIFLRKKSFILKKYKTPSPHIKTHSRWRYKKVGLLGGTFNPPHVGHLHVANSALKKYKFHAIWWLVSPQNPLKKRSDNFKKRLFMTKSYISHPKMIATNIESVMNVSYSLQTIQNLKKRFSRTQFHWLAGMDNAKNFHHWQGWKKII